MERDALDVLLVEDDDDDFFIIERLLSKARTVTCNLTRKPSYADGLQALLQGSFDVALVDYRLGARTGLDLLREAQGCGTPVVVMTGQGGADIDLEAMEAGAADYLNKAKLDTELIERTLRYAHERSRSAHEIRRQAALLDEAQDAICAYDLDGCVTYWSEGAARMTGYTQEEAGNLCSAGCLYGIVDQEALDDAWDTVLAEGDWIGELEQQTADGDIIVVKSRWTLVEDRSGTPNSVLVINTDVTERQRLEAQALRSQRMESIGRLVGGIAHDLGNLLVPIQLGVSVLRERYPEDERTARTLRMIEKSAERGSDMVERVLSFARGAEGDRRPLDLTEIAQEVERLVEESFPSNIEFEGYLPERLPPVYGDATQLQQVLVNLSVNARDAMPDGGRLTLWASTTHLDEDDVRLQPSEAMPGHHIHFCVEDTGTGITPEVLEKVFDPFFTTKQDGGTGLGLSTVYSIVTSHGGFVDVQSTPGKGTRFDLFFPVHEDELATDAAADAAPVAASLPAGEEATLSESERVLIIDDEAFVRESTEAVLAGAGYHPLTAADLDDALELVETHEVHAILTDAAAGPGADDTDTLEAVRAFRKRCPHVPVVVCSGHAGSRAEAAREAGAAQFLAKPFDADTLRQTLRQVLTGETA